MLENEENKGVYLDSIAGAIDASYLGSKSFLDFMARIWDENIHFYEGDQYLYYNDATNQYQSIPTNSKNNFIPRNVTNYIFPVVQTMTSILTKNKPSIKVIQNSESNEDINRAKLSDLLQDAKWEIDDEILKHQIAAKLIQLTGTAYRKDWWDTSGIEEIEIPGDKKKLDASLVLKGVEEERKEHPELEDKELRQLVIDHLKKDPNAYGKIEIEEEDDETESKKHEEKEEDDREKTEQEEEREVPKKLEDSDLEYEEESLKAPLGDNKVTILSVFEVIPDLQNAICSLDDGDFVMEATLHPVQWIRDTYDKKEKGYTGLAKSVKENTGLSLQLTYLERLKGSTARSGQYGVQPDIKDHCVLIECYIKPCRKYPKGLMIIVADKKVLYINASVYTYGNGINWHPYTMVRYDIHPLRHHGISLVEHLVPIQKRINAIKNLEVLTRMTMAIPQKLMPIGSSTPGFYWSGEPGLIIPYNPVVGIPAIIQGAGLDASIYREKEEDKMALHIIAGDNEILSGNKPAGANAASALNLLLEQSFSKFSPLIQQWENFIEKGQVKKLNLIRRLYREPRSSLVKRMKQINTDLTTCQIDDYFTGKDLGDNIDVRVEAGSSIPKSQAAHQENLKELLKTGVLGDLNPATNPVGNMKFREEFGISDFPTITGNDTKRAKWENDLLRQKKFEDVEVLPQDDPVIHYNIVVEETKRPEFYLNMDEEVIAQFLIHALKHYLDMTPEQVMQAKITPVQEQKIVKAGLQLIGTLNETEAMQLQQKAMVMQQAMQPDLGATASNQAGSSPPATMPPGESGGTNGMIPPDMALNMMQGGNINV